MWYLFFMNYVKVRFGQIKWNKSSHFELELLFELVRANTNDTYGYSMHNKIDDGRNDILNLNL